MSLQQAFFDKIADRSLKVGVVGLGYVGLPFAVEKAKMGFSVIGIEQNPRRADMVNRGENYIGDVDDAELKELVESGKLRAVVGFDVTPGLDAIVIAVPTPLNKNLAPDLQFIESVTTQLAPRIRKGQLISLESTTFPGTTEEVMLPILAKSGLTVDEDYWLAHSPERVDPGNQRYSTKNTNKVVGGVGPNSLEVAVAFYRATLDYVVPVSSAKAAELVKVFENTFRAVNIALVNELLKLCDRMGIDVWEVLEAANTKPFGIMRFMPGPGVGGHCIPLDPHYLEWKAREYNFTTRFIALAGEINRSMPEFVRSKAMRVLNKYKKSINGSKILVLGVAYKKDIDDWRESPALDVMKLLMDSGAELTYHDPFVPSFDDVYHTHLKMSSVPLTPERLAEQDLVVITTDHTTVDYELVAKHAPAIFDTRNATKNLAANKDKVTVL
ncbi:MAG: nucleotide sugar dehydrogenase [Fimbriimonadaceae bacterium]|nr:nucleotide sugar dehydrogenase [Fimbriimonadaceae bacterium]